MTPQHSRAADGDLIKQLTDLSERLERTEARLEHFVSHDRMYPTPGCEFCGVRRAA